MPSHRKNTLVIDFSVLPKRPVLDQVEKFVKNIVKLDMADVKNIQIHNIKNCVYVEMNDAGVAPRLQKQHHLLHYFTHEGKTYHIPIFVDGPTTTIRIHDLPPQMSNTIITDHMQQYGKVISIENEVWKNYFPGLPNGVRVVRMRLEKSIPSRIVVGGESTYVSYLKPNENTTSNPTTSNAPDKQNKIDDKQISTMDPPAVPTSATDIDDSNDDRDSSDDDDNEDDEIDVGNNNTDERDERTSETAETAKRRLSTETVNGTIDENIAKRSCNKGGQKLESEWKVYHTRSRKK